MRYCANSESVAFAIVLDSQSLLCLGFSLISGTLSPKHSLFPLRLRKLGKRCLSPADLAPAVGDPPPGLEPLTGDPLPDSEETSAGEQPPPGEEGISVLVMLGCDEMLIGDGAIVGAADMSQLRAELPVRALSHISTSSDVQSCVAVDNWLETSLTNVKPSSGRLPVK
eukprot:3643346-Rhodomonas_salina.1